MNIGMETCGLLRDQKYGVKIYFLNMTISPERCVRAEPVRHKSDAYEMRLEHIAWLEGNAGTRVKKVHWGNAKGFLSLKLALRNM